ncbi:MAG: alpha/beta hydrolase [Methanoregula sp.]|nr:alpha/beta hydrolase [Methanoregula sp.]
MVTFVLIHGGHNDGGVWNPVIPYLEVAGSTVFAPTLTDPDKTTLEGHISEVCTLIAVNRLDRIILVGHSYASMVITGVAARMPERIARLIYLDSALPKSGDSLFGIMERCGAPYEKFGLIPDRPFVDPLIFDEEIIRMLPKTYVHCTKSEFLTVGKCAFAGVQKNARQDNWTYYELESLHNCMNAVPEQVAAILLGTGIRS